MPSSTKHHSGLDENDTRSRMTHATAKSFVRHIPAKHVFGDVEEIAHRVGGTIPSLPDHTPTTFRQLGPDSAGGNYHDKGMSPKKYKGDQKFGNPRRYA